MVALFCSTAAQASTGYVSNRSQWNTLSDSEKLGYVMGAFDRHIVLTNDGEENGENERARKIRRCVQEKEVSNSDLLKLVEETYSSDVKFFDYPPFVVVMNVLYRLCIEEG